MKRRAGSDLYTSRVYRDVNVVQEEKWWNYTHFKPKWSRNQDNYEVVRKIGRGKYSDVFEGVNKDNERVVIKVLKPVKKKKVRREIKILTNLRAKCLEASEGGGDKEKGDKNRKKASDEKKQNNKRIVAHGAKYIITLIECIEDQLSKTKCLIFEHVDACDFKTLFPQLSDIDVRYYMYKLLLALDFCHQNGIMHRDVKPHNVMINHRDGTLKLIDWGLAEFYHPGQEYNVRVASRYFKGPELLVNFRTYDYSLDIWSFGCMFAGMIFRRHPFFRGRSNEDQLVKIVQVLGSAGFYAYLNRYNLTLPAAYDDYKDEHFNPDKPYKKKKFSNFRNNGNKHLANDEALELLSMCLRYDHQTRPTAKEASTLRYFDKVKKDAQNGDPVRPGSPAKT